MPVIQSCRLLGLPRSTYYRIQHKYRHYRPVPAPIPHTARVQPAALTPAERAEIVTILGRGTYAELSVDQTYWRAFDTGEIGCSQRSFYRVAAAARLSGDRRRVRTGSAARHAPCALAVRVNQLWTWDATELHGPGRQRYKLSVILDVYSRYPIGWQIEHHESAQHAVSLFTAAIANHGSPEIVHSDNGAPMRSRALLALLGEQAVTASFSRPRVSNDNPFSESLFKTLKYDLDCPPHFDSIEHAHAWTARFFHRYATQHRHSGLARHTPASVYYGTAHSVQTQRQAHLDRYHQQHPERFHKPPKPPP